jgi:hypothetical protein
MMFQDDTTAGHEQAYEMLKCSYANGVNFFDNGDTRAAVPSSAIPCLRRATEARRNVAALVQPRSTATAGPRSA